ncbi:hypothetical protein ACFL50_02450 [Candidatus Latescibacterota bacterium]
MNDFITLYFKELKNMKRELLIILGVIIGVLLYVDFLQKYIPIIDEYPFEWSYFDHFMLFILGHLYYIFPLLFLYSISRRKSQTLNQSELYRNRKHSLVFIRFLVFVNAMILLAVITFINQLLLENGIIPRPIPIRGAQHYTVVLSSLIYGFNEPFIWLSLICTAWGVMQIVRRFRILVGLAIAGVNFLIYRFLIKLGYNMFVENVYNFRKASLGSLKPGEPLFGSFFESPTFGKLIYAMGGDIFSLIFSILLGSIFCAVGIYLIKLSQYQPEALKDNS